MVLRIYFLKEDKKINIALFGGSFDPPHIGHEMIVKSALNKLKIDKLYVVPTYLNPFKESFHTPADIRYKWLKKLFKDFDKVEVSDFEIKQKRAVATIETVEYFYKKYNIDKFYLIIGDDNLENLHKWKEYEKLKKSVIFVVATRYKKEYSKNLKILNISANISSTKLRENLDTKYLPASISKDIIKYYKEYNGQQD